MRQFTNQFLLKCIGIFLLALFLFINNEVKNNNQKLIQIPEKVDTKIQSLYNTSNY